MGWCSEVISVSGAVALPLAPTVAASICSTESFGFQFRKPFFKFNCFPTLSLTHRKPLVVPAAPPCRAQCSAAQHSSSTSRNDSDFVVVNFYHFVFIKDPQAEVTKHLSFLEVRFHFLFSLPVTNCLVRIYTHAWENSDYVTISFNDQICLS